MTLLISASRGGSRRPRLRTRSIDGLSARASAPRPRVGWRLPTPHRSGTTAHCLMECCFTAPRAEPWTGATGDEHRRRHAAVRADQSRARIRSRETPERVQGRRAEALVPPRSGIRTRRGDLVAPAGGARRLVVEHCEGGATRSADEAALRERFGHAALVRGRRPARPTRPGGALRGHGGTGRTEMKRSPGGCPCPKIVT